MKVSVIIPAFNVENYLKECVFSALYQTYEGIEEIIIVDNNSTDNTLQAAKLLESENKSKIRVYQQNVQGAGAARNLGLKHAKGDWIQFLDADDLLLPGKIKHQVRIIQANQEVDPSFLVASCIRVKKHKTYKTALIEDDPFFNLLLSGEGRSGNTCANLWNKTYLDKVKGFDENLPSSQETDLMLRLLEINPCILYDHEYHTVTREREDTTQISHKKRYLENKQTSLAIKKRIVHAIVLKQPGFFKERKKEAKKIYYQLVYHLLKNHSEFNKEALFFFNQHLFNPWYLKVFPFNNMRYEAEKKVSKIAASPFYSKLRPLKKK